MTFFSIFYLILISALSTFETNVSFYPVNLSLVNNNIRTTQAQANKGIIINRKYMS